MTNIWGSFVNLPYQGRFATIDNGGVLDSSHSGVALVPNLDQDVVIIALIGTFPIGTTWRFVIRRAGQRFAFFIPNGTISGGGLTSIFRDGIQILSSRGGERIDLHNSGVNSAIISRSNGDWEKVSSTGQGFEIIWPDVFGIKYIESIANTVQTIAHTQNVPLAFSIDIMGPAGARPVGFPTRFLQPAGSRSAIWLVTVEIYVASVMTAPLTVFVSKNGFINDSAQRTPNWRTPQPLGDSQLTLTGQVIMNGGDYIEVNVHSLNGGVNYNLSSNAPVVYLKNRVRITEIVGI